jgi:surface protein
MFDNASSYNQPLASWNVNQVTNMGYMFNAATSYNQSLASWNVSQVTNMSLFAYNSPLCSPTLLPKAFIKSIYCS